MSVLGNAQLLMTPEGYQISRSVRLRSSASAYFNRTPASATNQTTWTWSGWVKRGALGSAFLFGAYKPPTGGFTLYLFSGDTLQAYQYNDGTGVVWNKVSTQVLRDPSAWYHLVLTYDSTNATAGDRVRLYVNGSRITSFSTSADPSSSLASWVNTTNRHTIGNNTTTLTDTFFDGYLTEINFIDGQALTPSSFGETDTATGVWKPKKYAGTYGTNGFYLNFSDNSSNTATTIGKDYSGNGNNWTPNNISLTSGATYDSMIDVPTLYADGGNGRGNYAVLNPLNNPAAATFADGNLKVTNANSDYRGALSTIAIPTSGKWYWEIQSNATTSASSIVNMGIAPLGIPLSGNQNGYTNSAAWYLGNAVTYWIPGGTSIGASSTSDVFQIAYDAATGKVWLGRNNTWYWGNTSTNNTTGDPAGGTNQSFTLTPTEFYAWAFAYSNGFISNFGQRPFAYTPPSGFKALNTQNLPEPTIKKGNQYFDVSTWTGTNSTGARTITGLAFQPDLVWGKSRSSAFNNQLYDSVRGTGKSLISNSTAAEDTTNVSGYISAFNSDGFTATPGSSDNWYWNYLNGTFVAWQWKEGATPGFDIVTYTGTGANRTVAHSLGVAPSMVIVKRRNTTSDWVVWHSAISAANYLSLNLTSASTAGATIWNSTAPTSSVFSVGTSVATNGSSDTYVAYLFAEVAGFSKFGSYTGNGSADGPFVYCGFRPKYVLIKNSSGLENWMTYDSARDTYNVETQYLNPNTSSAEGTLAASIDFLSNGFKIRYNASPLNTSSGTYIFAAFAENPFKNSLAR